MLHARSSLLLSVCTLFCPASVQDFSCLYKRPEHPLTYVVVALHIMQDECKQAVNLPFQTLYISLAVLAVVLFAHQLAYPGLEFFYSPDAFFFGVSVIVSLFAPYCILENMIQGGEEPGKLGAGVLFFCAVHVSKVVQQAFLLHASDTIPCAKRV